MITESEVKEMLVSKGIFPSFHRIKILKYILETRSHPTTEEIYQALSKEIPTLSRSTVYNNLHVLYEKGLLKRLNLVGDETRYDLTERPHAHLRCRRCGRIYDLDLPLDQISEVVMGALKGSGHVPEELDIVVTGLCRSCAEAEGLEGSHASS